MSDGIATEIMARAARANEGDELTEEWMRTTDAKLVARAEAMYGSWEAALAQALMMACTQTVQTPTPSSAVPRKTIARPKVHAVNEVVAFDREPEEGWDGPIVMVAADRMVFQVNADRFSTAHQTPVTAQPFAPEGRALSIEVAMPNPGEDVVVALSNTGTAHSFDSRIVPHIEGHTLRASDVIGVASDESIVALMSRRQLRRSGRFVHVTVEGKIKASSIKDFGRGGPDRHGAQALLLSEQDAICTAFLERDKATRVFCASLAGNGIHFSARDVRTMGLKAQGVKAMAVGDDFDAVVGAFNTDGCQELVVLSAFGYGKRVALDEFRVQGRGGQGMILMRPHVDGDELAAIAPLSSLHQDLLVLTLGGHVARIAAPAIPAPGRSARGLPLVALPDGDRISTVCVLPGSGPA
ncbi:MAG: DNA gyrase C-terminal beta-propeller domain-containing protein [Myxococcota bacterium]